MTQPGERLAREALVQALGGVEREARQYLERPNATVSVDAAIRATSRALSTERAAEGWQDIESAPRDGETWVDVWLVMPAHVNGGLRVTDCIYLGGKWREAANYDPDHHESLGDDPEDQRWFDGFGFMQAVETPICRVTHWMPLPATPDRARGDGDG